MTTARLLRLACILFCMVIIPAWWYYRHTDCSLDVWVERMVNDIV